MSPARESGNNGATPVEPIAIIGIGCRFSGDATSPSDLWNMISKGRTGWSQNAGDRYKMDAFWHPKSDISGAFNTQGIHILKQNPAVFDNDFFGINGVEAKAMDPHHRLMLEVAYETFEDAGIPMDRLEGSNTGVYCTGYSPDYDAMLSRAPESFPIYRFTGNSLCFIANRISYMFDLNGPSMAIDTACSSAHHAIHEACQAIRAGDVDQALVGGANLSLDPDQMSTLASFQALSDHGRCYAFDEKASGYGRGEGVSGIFLKPLRAAQQDGDTIRGVIRGSAVGADGKTPGITVPSTDAYCNVIRKAYRLAGLDPKDTLFVEGHGTGTQKGDQIEAEAVKKVFCNHKRENELILGTVKGNLGHTEFVSGLASIITAVLMLEKGLIPPNPNYSQPREGLEFAQSGIRIPTKLQAWPDPIPRRISINNNGIGGTPAHLIIEAGPVQSPVLNMPKRPLLIALTHKRDSGVIAAAKKLRRFLSSIKPEPEKEQSILNDLAFTLGVKRTHHLHKAVFETFSIMDLKENLSRLTNGLVHPSKPTSKPRVLYVFTGQGAQWAGMGRELLSLYPVFAQSIRSSEQEILRLGGTWFLTTETTNDDQTSRINEAEFAQPCTTAIQIALIDLLDSWGVEPEIVCGHSSGEIAAAYAAKFITAKDAMKTAYFRGKMANDLKQKLPDLSGAMMAVAVGELEALEYVKEFGDRISLACINSPASVTMSGERASLEALRVQLKESGVPNRILNVDVPYHSQYMRCVAEGYQSSLQDTGTAPSEESLSSIKMVSSVTGEYLSPNQLDASYWARNLISPVRFSDALSSAVKLEPLQSDMDLVIEIGPHAALHRPIMQTLQSAAPERQVRHFAMLSRQENAVTTAIGLAGKLFLNGIKIDLDMVNSPMEATPKRTLVDLPTYQWHHDTSHWAMARRNEVYRLRDFPRHDLLGVRTEDSLDAEPTWRNYLRHSELPWLKDHRIQGEVIYPAAGYISMITEGLKQQCLANGNQFRRKTIHFREVSIQIPLVVPEGTAEVETLVQLRPVSYSAKENSAIWQEFRIFSVSSGESTEHCRGLVAVIEKELRSDDVEGVRNPTANHSIGVDGLGSLPWTEVTAGRLYKELADIGVEYTGPFASMELCRVRNFQGLSSVRVPEIASSMPSKHQETHIIHPATLDSCFQTAFLGLKAAGELSSTWVIAGFDELHLSSDIVSEPGEVLNVEAQVGRHGLSQINGDIVATDSNEAGSATALYIKGLHMSSLGSGPSNEAQTPDTGPPFCRIQWKSDPILSSEKDILSQCYPNPIEGMKGFKATFGDCCRVVIRQALDGLNGADEQKIEGHWCKFLQWMRAQDTMPVNMTEAELKDHMASFGANGDMLSAIHENIQQFLLGTADPLDILFRGNILDRVYSEDRLLGSCHDALVQYARLVAFKKPGMRVLEIGGGTGGLTVPLVEALFGQSGCTGTYVFTDISTGFFDRVAPRLKNFKDNVEYKKLDIELSPEVQGFEPGSFDLVVVSNVLHATQNMNETLSHIHTLLKPNGLTAIVEFTNPAMRSGMFGCLPGWWRGLEDDRDLSPLLSITGWSEALKSAGFSGVDFELKDVCDDDEHEFSTIVSSAVPRDTTASNDPITVVASSTDNGVAQQFCDSLQASDPSRVVSQTTLSSVQVFGGKFIFLLDLADSFLLSPSEEDWKHLRHILSEADGILWVTCGGAADCPDPKQSLMSGLARCLKSENLDRKVVTVDLDPQTSTYSSMAEDILRIFNGTIDSPGSNQHAMEWEFAIRSGKVMIPRLTRDEKVDNHVQDSISRYHPRLEAEVHPKRALSLGIGTPGLLDSLYWYDSPAHSSPLKPGHMRIEMHYAALNFKDLMVAMGQLSGISALIFEGSGVVKEVGEAVGGTHSVGDYVYAFHPSGLATNSSLDSAFVHAIPQGMDMESAAAAPVVYATALYGLREAARIQPGESILIHSGAGAVGQAAISLAKYFGAGEIFVTVGNLKKADFVKEKFSIPDENIFSSRNTDFSKEILKLTGGRGVDVVLNSLGGDAIRQSCNALASLGRFIEIGKKDILTNARLEMRGLEKNISFVVVDLALLALERPKIVQTLIHDCLELVHNSKTPAVSPITTRSIANIGDHFRDMQAGRHTGKLLVDMKSISDIMVQPPRPKLAKLRKDGSYLIVGGTGEIGRAVAKYLAELGGGHIIALSRSGGDPVEIQGLAEQLQGLNSELTVVKGDVADLDTMTKVQEASGDRPVCGIIQAATDEASGTTVRKLTREDWMHSITAKVTGTMNIGHCFNNTLDFLILTSSLVGIIGTYGSSAYAAANTFQDAFSRHHSSRGIPIRAINIGLITTGGVVADRSDAEDVMAMIVKQGVLVSTMEEVLALINYAIQDAPVKNADDAQILCRLRQVNPNSTSEERTTAPPDARFSHIWVDPNHGDATGGKVNSQQDVQQALRAASTPGAVIEAMLSAMKGKMSQLLAIPEIELQSDRSIVSYGVDSLVSVELRNWIVGQLSAHIQMVEVLSSKPMAQIAEMLARRSRFVSEDVFGEKESSK